MATGALDANGIWQYGEDDSEPTFSGMLNKLGNSVSTTVTRLEELGGITTAQATTARNNLRVGMVAISPTSVAVAGGTQSTSTLGLVTFSGATSLSLNGVFTSTYDAYMIVLQMTGHSANSASFMRLRASGTDNSAANYTYSANVITPTTTTRVYQSAQTAAEIEYGAAGFWGMHTYSVTNAAVAGHTAVTRQSTYVGASGMETAQGGFYHNVSTAYDGFTIYPGTGSISGRIQVFAYNN